MTKKRKRKRGGASHSCPKCGGPTHVLITRRQDDGAVVRKRQCLKCKHSFSTMEEEFTLSKSQATDRRSAPSERRA